MAVELACGDQRPLTGNGSTLEALRDDANPRTLLFTFFKNTCNQLYGGSHYKTYLQNPLLVWHTCTHCTQTHAHTHVKNNKFLLSRQLTSNTDSSKDASYQETIVDPLTSSKSRRQLPVTFISEVQSPSPLLHNNNIGYLLCK